MNFINVFVLSVIEGFTEFLPISSTGHLILASKIMGLTEGDFLKTFEIAIQLGAIFAVVFLYWKKFFIDFEIYKKLIVAFLPTAIVGFLLYPFIKGYLLGNSAVALVSLFVGGLILIFFNKESKNGKIGIRQAFWVGIFQSVSVIPGISRAAATIIGGLWVGASRKNATEFSFLLAVPTMFAATGYDIYKSRDLFTTQNTEIILLGFVLSFVFAAISIKFLINYVKKNNFAIFGVYRIILSILFWIFVK